MIVLVGLVFYIMFTVHAVLLYITYTYHIRTYVIHTCTYVHKMCTYSYCTRLCTYAQYLLLFVSTYVCTYNIINTINVVQTDSM